ncbi:MAG: hypothetical protein FJY37_01615 [Betaproteobacteria bacterium]|nr:hypothetical protein [Betaproteobacteria bacterium]
MRAPNLVLVAGVAASISALPVHAAGGDPEAGRKKTVTCNACHGQASMQSVPNLGGQSPTYFVAAMRAYQDGKRGHATMGDVAKAYSDKELKNFVAYYTQFIAESTVSGAEQPASALACEACHGPDGRAPVIPESAVLAGQKAPYPKTTLREYRAGTRKHAVMQGAVGGLSDADVDALSAYYAGLWGLVAK